MDERIQLSDTPMSAIIKLSGGNPGAVRVCAELVKRGAEIDPDAFGGGLSGLLSLDAHRIYGPDIWTLYKDVCGESLPKMVAVLRAVQLGFESGGGLMSAIHNRGTGIDVDTLFTAVCERLPNFAKANALESSEVV